MLFRLRPQAIELRSGVDARVVGDGTDGRARLYTPTSGGLAGQVRVLTPDEHQQRLAGTNWKEPRYGDEYFQGRLKGRPDQQRRIRDLIQKFGNRVDAVNADFATKHGWEVSRTHAEDIEGFWNDYLIEDAVE